MYFVSEGLQVVFRTLDEVLLQNLNGNLRGLDGGVRREAQVHLRSVALPDLLSDIVLAVEDWVLFLTF